MKKVLLATCLCLAIWFCQATALDATSVWNQNCAQYHFGYFPQPPTYTFADAYGGSDLSGDFAAIKAVINSSLMSSGNGIDEEDLVNATLQNWN